MLKSLTSNSKHKYIENYNEKTNGGKKTKIISAEGGQQNPEIRKEKIKKSTTKSNTKQLLLGLDEDFDDDNGVMDSGELKIDQNQMGEYFHLETGKSENLAIGDDNSGMDDSRELSDYPFDGPSSFDPSSVPSSVGKYFEMPDDL